MFANNENNYHGLEFVHDVYQVSLTNGGISNTDLLEAYNYFLNKINDITQDEILFSDLVDLVIVEPESGCDCYYGSKCKRERSCMYDISPQTILDKINFLLKLN